MATYDQMMNSVGNGQPMENAADLASKSLAVKNDPFNGRHGLDAAGLYEEALEATRKTKESVNQELAKNGFSETEIAEFNLKTDEPILRRVEALRRYELSEVTKGALDKSQFDSEHTFNEWARTFDVEEQAQAAEFNNSNSTIEQSADALNSQLKSDLDANIARINKAYDMGLGDEYSGREFGMTVSREDAIRMAKEEIETKRKTELDKLNAGKATSYAVVAKGRMERAGGLIDVTRKLHMNEFNMGKQMGLSDEVAFARASKITKDLNRKYVKSLIDDERFDEAQAIMDRISGPFATTVYEEDGEGNYKLDENGRRIPVVNAHDPSLALFFDPFETADMQKDVTAAKRAYEARVRAEEARVRADMKIRMEMQNLANKQDDDNFKRGTDELIAKARVDVQNALSSGNAAAIPDIVSKYTGAVSTFGTAGKAYKDRDDQIKKVQGLASEAISAKEAASKLSGFAVLDELDRINDEVATAAVKNVNAQYYRRGLNGEVIVDDNKASAGGTGGMDVSMYEIAVCQEAEKIGWLTEGQRNDIAMRKSAAQTALRKSQMETLSRVVGALGIKYPENQTVNVMNRNSMSFSTIDGAQPRGQVGDSIIFDDNGGVKMRYGDRITFTTPDGKEISMKKDEADAAFKAVFKKIETIPTNLNDQNSPAANEAFSTLVGSLRNKLMAAAKGEGETSMYRAIIDGVGTWSGRMKPYGTSQFQIRNIAFPHQSRFRPAMANTVKQINAIRGAMNALNEAQSE